jgi:hypothetical protein
MARRGWPLFVLLFSSLFLGACVGRSTTGGSASPATTPLRAPTAQILEAYGRVPLHFEENQGQAADDVRYLARTRGGVIALTSGGFAVAVDESAVRLSFAGARPTPPMHALDALPGRVNYYLGPDPSQWRTNVPTYGRVRYEAVYPGVDVVVYGNQQRLEYDFVVAPGADPRGIRVRVDGADAVELDGAGDLTIRRGDRTIVQHAPVVYQERDGRRESVDGRYVVRGREITFALGAYDRTRPLIIDPVVVYATRIGVGFVSAIAVDGAGHAYITGSAGTSGYPVVNGNPHNVLGKPDIFVTKMSPAGNSLVFSTFIGGGGPERATGIAVDAAGNAWVSGVAGPDRADGFPTTPDALMPTAINTSSEGTSGIVFRMSPTGTLLYSTYLMGTAAGTGGVSGSCYQGSANGVAIDAAGNAYVAGYTTTTNFPMTAGAYQTAPASPPQFNSCPDAKGYVVEFTTAHVLGYSTYLDTTESDAATGVAVSADGNAFVSGFTNGGGAPFTITTNLATGPTNAWIVKLDAASLPVWATKIGPSPEGMAVGADGTLYVAGAIGAGPDTFSTVNAFQPTANGGGDGFAARLNASGTAYLWSTYIGGTAGDGMSGVAVAADGSAWVGGATQSSDFPTKDPVRLDGSAANPEVVLVRLSATGTLLFGTYLGEGSSDGLAIDGAGSVYLTGLALGDFPMTPGAWKTTPTGGGLDVFVLKFGEPAGGGSENVVWTSPVKVAVSGNAITKNAGCNGCADAGAISQQTVASGNGGVEFKVSAAFAGTVGLSNGNPGTSGSEIKFGLRFFSGYVEVRESGVWKASWPIAAGDTHKVAVDGGAVKYFVNGTLKYTSTLVPSYPLLVDASLNAVGTAVQGAVMTGGGPAAPTDSVAPTATITSPAFDATVSGMVTVTVDASDNVGVIGVKLEINGAIVAEDTTASYAFPWDTTTVANGPHLLRAIARDAAGNITASSFVRVTVSNSSPPPGGNVVWTSPVKVAVSGNTITKNAGCGGCADAGAVSQQTIGSGSGGVQFTVSSGFAGTVGLSNGNPGTSGSEIKFGLRFFGTYVEVRESGAFKATWPITAGAVHKVAVDGGAVKYFLNGTLKHTSTAAPSFPLLVDTSLNNVGGAVQNAVMTP